MGDFFALRPVATTYQAYRRKGTYCIAKDGKMETKTRPIAS